MARKMKYKITTGKRPELMKQPVAQPAKKERKKKDA